MDNGPLLMARGLRCTFSGSSTATIFEDVNLELLCGEVVVLTGRSGSGKTTLLKCLSSLIPYEGEILFRGRKVASYGIPLYRTRVLYVPQRTSLLPSTPREFLLAVERFGSRKRKNDSGNATDGQSGVFGLAKSWDVDDSLWDRAWSNLSGGEAQRIALAIAVGLNTAEVLLLDEPTSALDAETTELVEKTILDEIKAEGMLKAIICITHSEEQGRRIGTRFIHMNSIASSGANTPRSELEGQA